MSWIIQHIWNIICAIFVGLIGYFMPVENLVHVMSAAIIFDLFTGILASHKRGIGIKSLRLWRTVYKLFYSVVIVMLLFGMDKEMGVKFIQMHKLVAWLITGFEIWSILENVSVISNLRIFIILKSFMTDKIKEQTGVDINKEK